MGLYEPLELSPTSLLLSVPNCPSRKSVFAARALFVIQAIPMDWLPLREYAFVFQVSVVSTVSGIHCLFAVFVLVNDVLSG